MNDRSLQVTTGFELPCRVQATCGGCPMMALGPDEQARSKLEQVTAALEARGVTVTSPATFRREGSSLNYRNRLRLKVHPGGRVGFFNEEKDEACPVVSPSVRTLLHQVTRHSVADPTWMTGVNYLDVRGEDADGLSALAVYPLEGQAIDWERLTQQLGPSVRVEIPPLEHGAGVTQRFVVHGDCYVRIPIGGFMQVNHAVNRALIKHVVHLVTGWNIESFLDLYCGAGNYTIPLAASGLRGHGIEVAPAAIFAAERAATEQGIPNLTFQTGDATKTAEQLAAADKKFDVVVANPPRSGLRECVRSVAKLARHGLVLCSCDAQAFARDLAALSTLGWMIEGVTVFDMFPHTRHMECCAWLMPSSP